MCVSVSNNREAVCINLTGVCVGGIHLQSVFFLFDRLSSLCSPGVGYDVLGLYLLLIVSSFNVSFALTLLMRA